MTCVINDGTVSLLGIKYGLGQYNSGHNPYLYGLCFTDYNVAAVILIVCQSFSRFLFYSYQTFAH
jgi:hypothetical protein